MCVCVCVCTQAFIKLLTCRNFLSWWAHCDPFSSLCHLLTCAGMWDGIASIPVCVCVCVCVCIHFQVYLIVISWMLRPDFDDNSPPSAETPCKHFCLLSPEPQYCSYPPHHTHTHIYIYTLCWRCHMSDLLPPFSEAYEWIHKGRPVPSHSDYGTFLLSQAIKSTKFSISGKLLVISPHAPCRPPSPCSSHGPLNISVNISAHQIFYLPHLYLLLDVQSVSNEVSISRLLAFLHHH